MPSSVDFSKIGKMFLKACFTRSANGIPLKDGKPIRILAMLEHWVL
jgi:hypothetical protein